MVWSELYLISRFRQPIWRRPERWEDTCPWVTVELASTENIQLVEVKPVECIITEFFSTNCMVTISSLTPFSHPGYFGKKGQRHFHLKRNQYHSPSVNLDKLWSLVTEQTRLSAQKNTDRAPVIDVTKAVILYYISHRCRVTSKYWAKELSPRSQSSLRPSSSPSQLNKESRKPEVLASLQLD